jgi:hypothetical protein
MRTDGLSALHAGTRLDDDPGIGRSIALTAQAGPNIKVLGDPKNSHGCRDESRGEVVASCCVHCGMKCAFVSITRTKVQPGDGRVVGGVMKVSASSAGADSWYDQVANNESPTALDNGHVRNGLPE